MTPSEVDADLQDARAGEPADVSGVEAPVHSQGQQVALAVLTPGRCGSSLAMKLLQLLGVYLGEDCDMVAADQHNRRGYWEHKELKGINDELLRRFGGNVSAPPDFPPRWEDAGFLNDLYARAEGCLAKHFSSRPIWAWKDPRTALLLPFWQRVVNELRYLLLLRNPLEMAASQERWGNWPVRRGVSRWIHHTTQAVNATAGQPRLVVFFEDILADPIGQVRRMAGFIGVPHRLQDPDLRRSVEQVVDTGLCHHHAGERELFSSKSVTLPARLAYLALRWSVAVQSGEKSYTPSNEEVWSILDTLFCDLHTSLAGTEATGWRLWKQLLRAMPLQVRSWRACFEITRLLRVYSDGGASAVVRGLKGKMG